MNRPFVHVNCASTLDGRIANPDGSRLRISCREDMKRVHRLRAEIGAIMVGANTVITDDPKLTVKDGFVDDPPALVKIILDGRGRISPDSRFLRTPGRSIIITSERADISWLDGVRDVIREEGLDARIDVIESGEDRIEMAEILDVLHGNGIGEILVEGGSSVIEQMILKELFDVLTIYFGPILIGGNGPGIVNRIIDEKGFHLSLDSVEEIGEGFLVTFGKA